MPDRDWYLSADVLAAEHRHVFGRSWLAAASAEDVPHPGDYLTLDVAGEPLVVVRDHDGAVRAFRNVCRHRGLLLLEGAGHVESQITCSYHDWAYGLDGRLERVPQQRQQFHGLDRTCWGLRPVALYDWHGLIFVNADDQAPSFETSSAPLFDRLEPLLAGPLVHLSTVRHHVRANWKILLENHLDFYHLWYLHRDSLGQYRHSAVSRQQLGDHFWSIAPLIDTTTAPSDLAWITEQERTGIGAHLLFPNLGIVTTGAYLLTYDAMPLAPDQTIFTLRLRGLDGAPAEAYLKEVHAFLDQDLGVCERLQAGLASSGWGLGPLACDHEKPVADFQNAVAAHLSAEVS